MGGERLLLLTECVALTGLFFRRMEMKVIQIGHQHRRVILLFFLLLIFLLRPFSRSQGVQRSRWIIIFPKEGILPTSATTSSYSSFASWSPLDDRSATLSAPSRIGIIIADVITRKQFSPAERSRFCCLVSGGTPLLGCLFKGKTSVFLLFKTLFYAFWRTIWRKITENTNQIFIMFSKKVFYLVGLWPLGTKT